LSELSFVTDSLLQLLLLRRITTSSIVDRGWPRALDLVNPSCRCSGSLTASTQPSLLLARCMAASVHSYSQSSVCISCQGPKIAHHKCQKQTGIATYYSRVCHEIQNVRAVAHVEPLGPGLALGATNSLALKQMLQISPNRLRHENRTYIAHTMRVRLH
jgi:hypothetical protein